MPICCICRAVEGPRSRCPECNREYMRAYRAANLEKVKAGQRDHYVRNRALVKEKVKAYAVKNKDAVKASKAKRYDQTKEARRAKIKEWQDKNPERVKEIMRAACLNRVARKAGADGSYSIKDIKHLFRTQEGECAACRTSLSEGYHVDHIKPLSRGGSNWPENLQLLCPSCNVRKGAMPMEEFMRRNFENLART